MAYLGAEIIFVVVVAVVIVVVFFILLRAWLEHQQMTAAAQTKEPLPPCAPSSWFTLFNASKY